MATKLTKIIANFETQLATKISVGGESATLQSIKDDDNVNIPNGKYYLTIDGGTTQEEHILCDNTAGSLTNIKSVSRQGVESVGVVREHRVGAEVKLTDFAVLKIITDLLNGDKALDGSSPLNYDSNPTFTDDKEIITKKYADDLAIAGSPDASTTTKGISKLSVAPASPTNPIATGTNDPRIPSQDENDALAGSSGTPSGSNKYITEDDVKTTPTADKILRALGTGKINDGWINDNQLNTKSLTAGETINGATLPVAIYQSTSDNEIYACDGNDQAKLEFIGFAITNGTDGNPITIQVKGIVSGFTGLAEGTRYYVQDDKTIGTSKGTYEVLVGIAISETELLIIKGALEYMGSASVDTDGSTPTTIPTGTREIILTAFRVYSPGNYRRSGAEIVLKEKGATTLTTTMVNDEGTSTEAFFFRATWSGSNLTAKTFEENINTGAEIEISNYTITAYFYR